MRYINATQILPKKLLAEIQEYADGIFLYIPRRTNNKRPWGTATATRQELAKRNRSIFHDHTAGASVSELASQYFLSPKNYPAYHSLATRDGKKGATYAH